MIDSVALRLLYLDRDSEPMHSLASLHAPQVRALTTYTTVAILSDLHLEKGGMPLHNAVGIYCKKGATTEYRCADVKYMGYGVCVG